MWSNASSFPSDSFQRKTSFRESVEKRNCIPAVWRFFDRTPPFTFVETFAGRRS